MCHTHQNLNSRADSTLGRVLFILCLCAPSVAAPDRWIALPPQCWMYGCTQLVHRNNVITPINSRVMLPPPANRETKLSLSLPSLFTLSAHRSVDMQYHSSAPHEAVPAPLSLQEQLVLFEQSNKLCFICSELRGWSFRLCNFSTSFELKCEYIHKTSFDPEHIFIPQPYIQKDPTQAQGQMQCSTPGAVIGWALSFGRPHWSANIQPLSFPSLRSNWLPRCSYSLALFDVLSDDLQLGSDGLF